MMSTSPASSAETRVAVSGIRRKVIRFAAGWASQYWAWASATSWASRFHSTNLYGPAPTGAWMNVVPAHLLDGRLREDPRAVRGEPLLQQGIGRLRLEADGAGVRRLDLVQDGEVAGRLAAGVRAHDPVERVLDVLGGQLRAVVEEDAVAQLQLQGQVVQALPARRERGHQLVAVEEVAAEERVVEDVVHPDADVAELVGGVQAVRLAGVGDDEVLLLAGLRGGGGLRLGLGGRGSRWRATAGAAGFASAAGFAASAGFASVFGAGAGPACWQPARAAVPNRRTVNWRREMRMAGCSLTTARGGGSDRGRRAASRRRG